MRLFAILFAAVLLFANTTFAASNEAVTISKAEKRNIHNQIKGYVDQAKIERKLNAEENVYLIFKVNSNNEVEVLNVYGSNRWLNHYTKTALSGAYMTVDPALIGQNLSIKIKYDASNF